MPSLAPMKHEKRLNPKLRYDRGAEAMKMCVFKESFYTNKLAVEVARKYEKRFHKHFRPYQCPYCGKYHLTTQKP